MKKPNCKLRSEVCPPQILRVFSLLFFALCASVVATTALIQLELDPTPLAHTMSTLKRKRDEMGAARIHETGGPSRVLQRESDPFPYIAPVL
jgi:hypothetical protein